MANVFSLSLSSSRSFHLSRTHIHTEIQTQRFRSVWWAVIFGMLPTHCQLYVIITWLDGLMFLRCNDFINALWICSNKSCSHLSDTFRYHDNVRLCPVHKPNKPFIWCFFFHWIWIVPYSINVDMKGKCRIEALLGLDFVFFVAMKKMERKKEEIMTY